MIKILYRLEDVEVIEKLKNYLKIILGIKGLGISMSISLIKNSRKKTSKIKGALKLIKKSFYF